LTNDVYDGAPKQRLDRDVGSPKHVRLGRHDALRRFD
jgi:hypothetical protein